MQQLNLNENTIVEVEPKKRFWRRQFQKEATKSQIKFDWFFGVIMPVICFVFDPIVFKGAGYKGALYGSYKPFAYILSFVSIMAMSAWLLWGKKLKGFNVLLSGLFFVCGFISLTIGIFLLPFSLLGLILIIGILGFTPLFSSLVFSRNALRACILAKPFLEKNVLVYSLILSALFSIVIPSVINSEINKKLNEMIQGDVQTILENARTLKFVSPLVDATKLGGKYCKPDERHEALAEVYKQFTGESIEMLDRRICEDW